MKAEPRNIFETFSANTLDSVRNVIYDVECIVLYSALDV